MKHLYFLSILIVCCSVARAQVNKGNIVLGGNLSYTEQFWSDAVTNASPSVTNFHGAGINPSIGKAIKDNLVLGLDIAYSHSATDVNNSGQAPNTIASNSFQAGVFVRRYRPLGNGFYLFGQAKLAFGYMNGNDDNPGSNSLNLDRSNGYVAFLQLYPGIAYAINHHWQIETGLPNFFSFAYNHTKETTDYAGQPEQTNTTHSFSVSTSLTGSNQLTVGVRYLIGE